MKLINYVNYIFTQLWAVSINCGAAVNRNCYLVFIRVCWQEEDNHAQVSAKKCSTLTCDVGDLKALFGLAHSQLSVCHWSWLANWITHMIHVTIKPIFFLGVMIVSLIHAFDEKRMYFWTVKSYWTHDKSLFLRSLDKKFIQVTLELEIFMHPGTGRSSWRSPTFVFIANCSSYLYLAVEINNFMVCPRELAALASLIHTC